MAYNVCIKPMNINKRRDERTDDWMVKNRACRGWWLPLALFFFFYFTLSGAHYLTLFKNILPTKVRKEKAHSSKRLLSPVLQIYLGKKMVGRSRNWEKSSPPFPPHFICVSIFWGISKINRSSTLRTLQGKEAAEVIFKNHHLCLLSFKPFFSKIIFFFTK